MFKNLEVLEARNIEIRLNEGRLQGRIVPISSGVVIGFARIKALLKYDTIPRDYVMSVAGVHPTSWVDVAVAIPRIPFRRLKWLNKVMKDNAIWVSTLLWTINLVLRFFKILSLEIKATLRSTLPT